MPNEKKLTGKVALVTGASRGIGRAIAEELASLGADVAITARTEAPRQDGLGSLQEAVEQLSEHGGKVAAVTAHLLDRADVDSLVGKVEAAMGAPVDVLVNNAAYMAPEMYSPFEAMSAENWRQQVELNLNVPFTLMKAVVPSMVERGGGRVINITTLEHGGDLLEVEDDRYMPGKGGVGAAYVASKLGLNGMTNSLAYELREQNVVVVAVHPGFTATENAQKISKELNFDISMAHPMSVPAKAVGYLASCDDPMSVTGQRLFAAEVVEQHGL